MTAETDLLPLPSVLLNWPHPTNHVAIRAYARANVAHAIAPLQAEIEALRAEASTAHAAVHYHIAEHAKTIARAERLAEALLRYGRHEHDCDTRHDAAHKDRPLCTCGLSAALEQEAGR